MRKKLEVKKKPKDKDSVGVALGIKKSALRKISNVTVEALKKRDSVSNVIVDIWDSDLKDNEAVYSIYALAKYLSEREATNPFEKLSKVLEQLKE